ncbi:tryptophanase leader peptide [Escherichia coli]|nr:tryptophanase leader peptide [Escherichia coli]
MNILHICVTSKWFNIDNKIVCRSPPLICPSVAITRAKPIRFNVIYLFAIS